MEQCQNFNVVTQENQKELGQYGSMQIVNIVIQENLKELRQCCPSIVEFVDKQII